MTAKYMKGAITAAALLASSAQLSATTVSADGGTLGAQFTTSTGTLLTATNSTITPGFISGDIFTAFAASDPSPITISTLTIPTFAGKWSGDTSDISNAADAFNSQQIWFEISVDLGGGAVGTAYLSDGSNFPVNAQGVGDSIAVNSNNLTQVNSVLSTPGTVGAAGGTIVVGVVPEPSIAILGALGFLGLARRRR